MTDVSAFSRLLLALDTPCCIVDSSGTILAGNLAWANVVGQPATDLPGGVADALRSANQTDDSILFRLTIAGQPYAGRAIRLTANRPLFAIAIESELQPTQGLASPDLEKLGRLEAILNTAVDAIITIDEHGVMIAANPAAEKLFQYTTEEMLGHNVSMLMPSPYAESHDGYMRAYQTTAKAKIIGIGREVTGRRKDGSIFPMDLAVSEVPLADRRLYTGIIRDISERKEAERQLNQLNEELEQRVIERTRQLEEAQSELVAQERLATIGRVAGGIAHEIRNPLNAVKTSVYFLLNASSLSEEKRYEHLDRINRQVTLANNVISTLSEFAKLPGPKQQRVNIRQCIANAAATVTPPVEIHFAPHQDLFVMVDPDQMVIAFRNLIQNAKEASAEDDPITICIRHQASLVLVNVIDQGEGMTKETLARIMEPLFSTKARGIGLGLAITKSIVEKNSGQLDVVSELGQGSTFTVSLPAANSD